MMSDNNWSKSIRLAGLRRFAVAITLLNILGHTFFGFEQSIAQPLVALATAYSTELLYELLEAWRAHRRPLFLGGWRSLVDFLLSAHITGLAVAMLLYANNRLWPIVFATMVALISKSLIRVRVGQGSKHLFNPSNLGISVALLAFPWVGIAPPYHFTENLDRLGDWLLPGIIIVSGTFINARLTKKLPLIAAWLGGFAAQAILRSLYFGTPVAAALLPMTGLAFVLFTFYMVTDPGTTPSKPKTQIAFGIAVAAVYGVLLLAHVVFGLFFALSLVCAMRGIGLYVGVISAGRVRAKPLLQATAPIATVSKEI